MKAETWEEFQALPEAVRNDVLEKRRYWNVDDESWYSDIFIQFRDEMKEVGIHAGEIYFSGFWSQGDGACFQGHLNDQALFFALPEMAKYAALKDAPYNLHRVGWVSDGRYCHEHTLRFDFEMNDEPPDENDFDSPVRYQAAKIAHADAVELFESFEEPFKEWVRGKCRDLYHTLEEEYEHQTSDEQVVESLIANECLNEAIEQACEALGIEEPEDEDEHV